LPSQNIDGVEGIMGMALVGGVVAAVGVLATMLMKRR
jgi:hypothetical protein